VSDRPATHVPPPDWLRRPGVPAISAAIGEARFVGGAVRDTLLGRRVGDLDLATPLPPDQVVRRLEAAGIRAIPTGLAHGTITALAGEDRIEITTLRRDVETDGRHAVVAFTDRWEEDAARRDLTMNALYMDASGVVWDPVGGLADCLAGRVRFVGDPRRRIAEDVLRLLRFYRFQAQYGKVPADPEARAACRDLAQHLPGLSGERVRAELLKLLAAADPIPTLRLMAEDRVLCEILPLPADLGRLEALLAIEPIPDPLRRLAALLPALEAPAVAERLRLSAKERDRLVAILAAAPAIDLDAPPQEQHRLLYRLGRDTYLDRFLLAAASRSRRDGIAASLAQAQAWPIPRLPVTGADLLALGVPAGERLGRWLRQIEDGWIEADFTADRAACLAMLGRLITEA
jgi:poly(A) polymerase